MTANLTQLSSILKNQYLGPVREQVNNKIVLLNRIGKDEDSVVGKNFTIPLHHGRNEGIGARADGGTLPTAGAQGYKEAIVPMKYMYGRIKLTGPTIKAAKSNEGAFIRAVESEMKGLAKDLKAEFNRMLYGDGTGILATCGTTTASTTVTVASTARLRVGMRVDVIKTADGTVSTGDQGATILTIPNATTFTIGSAITTDNTFSVYRAGSRNLEVMGLNGIFSDTLTLQGLDVATFAWWKANVLANGGTNRAISLSLMQTALDATETNSDGEVSAIYTTHGIRRAYQALLQADRVYQNTMEFDGGFKALDYNGLPLIADKDAVANTLFFADESHLKMYRMSDWEWMEEDGAILSRVSGEDAYEAVLFKYCELGCSARNAQTVLKDITEA